MRRKILIAELSDTTRSVAETILRQNGYEVIAVSDGNKVREVLDFSRPDLIIVGADLLGPDQVPYYEKIRQDPRVSATPLLLFEPVSKTDVTFPDEIVIPRPFDPKDLLAKVNVFLGQTDSPEKPPASPLGASGVDDDFLDAALGLDRIQVTDSEDMDKTSGIRRRPHQPQEKHVGLDHNAGSRDASSDSSRVESLMIPGDDSQIRHQPPKEVPPPPKGTGKLEILNDQYGLTDPEAPAGQHKSQVHDYDWFINAVREEDGAQSTTQQGGDEASPGPSDSGKLSFTNPAALVDPVTPGPAPVSPEATPAGASGVEKFIDEFKKEVEQLRSTEPDDLAGVEQKQLGTAPVEEMTWEEKLETITSEQVGLFTRELAQEVGRKVAELIATKIDSEKLMHLIKEELIKHCRRNP